MYIVQTTVAKLSRFLLNADGYIVILTIIR